MKKSIKPVIHIFHNGAVAEVNYFQDFKDFLAAQDAWVNISNNWKRTKGKAPWQVIDFAIKSKISKKDADQRWCVFDIDDFFKQDSAKFKKSLDLAKSNDVKVAWSNQCFEVWFMMHFDHFTTAIPRNSYEKKLRSSFKKIGIDYVKNSEKLFVLLLDFQATAIKNAKKIYKENKLENDPSTSVFLLVEELNKFLPKA